jgi:DNA-binding XRE family transcriptional regulator
VTLDAYLDRTYPHLAKAKQNEAFGQVVGCARQSIERWRKFQLTPSLETAYRIYHLSGRQVEPFDLLGRKQKREAMQ